MNINLSEIKKVITHDNCADGLASAIICREAIPGVEVVFCQYGTAAYDNLRPEPGVLFVDFSPKLEHAQAWVDAGAYILDHHKGAEDVVTLFGERGLFDNERCGAMLAFDEMCYRQKISERSSPTDADWRLMRFAHLADVRDRWQTDSPDWDEANAQHRVMMAVDRDVWLESGRFPSREELAFGELMAQTERKRAERIVATEMEAATIAGLRVGVCSAGGALSSAIGEAGRQAGYDVTAVFFHKRDPDSGEKSIVYSLRSNERFDVAEFAKHHGGGGHARAAGFSWTLKHDPWAWLLLLIHNHINGLTES